MNKAVVIIPIYKQKYSEREKMSLVQCCKILAKHNFLLVCPNDLDIKEYVELLNFYKINYTIERFENKFFESLKEYNQLMLDVEFYKKFSLYDFMLVYQLDAYVFRDELEYWCGKNYAYIGAPWFEGFNLSNRNSELLDISGNGGFSLRKISNFISILNQQKKTVALNEDLFFSKYAPKLDSTFNVAPPEVVMHFSFECQPRRLYQMTGNKLPFGCHAWEKYDPIFWNNFIKIGLFTSINLHFKAKIMYLKNKTKSECAKLFFSK